MSIPIFCISLERATERKEYIQKEWIDKLGFDITFWKAFDKKDLTVQDKQRNSQLLDGLIMNNIFYEAQYSTGAEQETAYSQIACVKTLISLYEYLLKNKYQEVIIMEDDITPLIKHKHELFDHIAQGKVEFPNAEIMILFEPRTPSDIIGLSKAHYFVSSMYPPWGNQLLYVNNKGMHHIISLFKYISVQACEPQQYIAKTPNVVIVSRRGLCSHDWTREKFKSYVYN